MDPTQGDGAPDRPETPEGLENWDFGRVGETKAERKIFWNDDDFARISGWVRGLSEPTPEAAMPEWARSDFVLSPDPKPQAPVPERRRKKLRVARKLRIMRRAVRRLPRNLRRGAMVQLSRIFVPAELAGKLISSATAKVDDIVWSAGSSTRAAWRRVAGAIVSVSARLGHAARRVFTSALAVLSHFDPRPALRALGDLVLATTLIFGAGVAGGTRLLGGGMRRVSRDASRSGRAVREAGAAGIVALSHVELPRVDLPHVALPAIDLQPVRRRLGRASTIAAIVLLRLVLTARVAGGIAWRGFNECVTPHVVLAARQAMSAVAERFAALAADERFAPGQTFVRLSAVAMLIAAVGIGVARTTSPTGAAAPPMEGDFRIAMEAPATTIPGEASPVPLPMPRIPHVPSSARKAGHPAGEPKLASRSERDLALSESRPMAGWQPVGGELSRGWRLTSPSRVYEVQVRLLHLGYPAGEPTGTLTGYTKYAIVLFQRDMRLPMTGDIDARLVRRLRIADDQRLRFARR